MDRGGGRADVARWRRNFRDEVDGAVIYRAMAKGEPNTELAEVYRRLGAVEARHVHFWADRLRRHGGRVPPKRPTVRARVLGLLAQRFGAAVVVPTVARAERLGQTMYDDQAEAADTSLPGDERSHAFLLGQIRGGVPGASLNRLEGRHRTPGGNAMRAAVLGANDGLLSNLSLVTGVAGSGLAGSVVLVVGLPEEQATEVAKRLLDDPDNALDVMAREELGLDPDERGGNPWTAALASFLLFAVGALVPVLPFVWLDGQAGALVAAVAGGLGLFALGAATTLFTGRGPLRSGLRQMLLGLAAAAVTYGVGALLGVAVV